MGAGRFNPQTMQKILGSILILAIALLGQKFFVLLLKTPVNQ